MENLRISYTKLNSATFSQIKRSFKLQATEAEIKLR